MCPTHQSCFAATNRAMKKLWRDESGVILSMELVLLATIILIGCIVGLSAYRDSIVQELGDASAAVSSLQQGYEYNEIVDSGTIDNMQFDFQIAGSTYVDNLNFCEPAIRDAAGTAPMCIEIVQTFDQEL